MKRYAHEIVKDAGETFLWIIALCLTGVAMTFSLSGCSTTQSDTYSFTDAPGVRVQEKQVRFKGTVERRHERYAIVSDSDVTYIPINLAPRYCEDGLRVQVHGETRGYAWGGSARRLEIYDIAAR